MSGWLDSLSVLIVVHHKQLQMDSRSAPDAQLLCTVIETTRQNIGENIDLNANLFPRQPEPFYCRWPFWRPLFAPALNLQTFINFYTFRLCVFEGVCVTHLLRSQVEMAQFSWADFQQDKTRLGGQRFVSWGIDPMMYYDS